MQMLASKEKQEIAIELSSAAFESLVRGAYVIVVSGSKKFVLHVTNAGLEIIGCHHKSNVG